MSFCLSKDLSAPVGSLLCGDRDFIERARKFCKMVGGGMRQAGVLAAAGIVALETMVDRLIEDYNNTQRLASGLSNIKGVSLENDDISTNIVMFNLSLELSAYEFLEGLEKSGVKIGSRGGNQFRVVTHSMVSTAEVDEAIVRFETVCNRLPG